MSNDPIHLTDHTPELGKPPSSPWHPRYPMQCPIVLGSSVLGIQCLIVQMSKSPDPDSQVSNDPIHQTEHTRAWQTSMSRFNLLKNIDDSR